MSDERTTEPPCDVSFGRDPDGELNIEFYIDRRNLVTISIGPEGNMSWAGMWLHQSFHGPGTEHQALGRLLWSLLSGRVKDE